MSEQTLDVSKERSNVTVFRLLFATCVALFVGSLYFYFFVNTAFVDVEIKVSEPTDFKIYWAKPKMMYAEENMSVITAHPGRTTYSFMLTEISKLERLRIDTHRYLGEATLRSLRIRQEGWTPIVLQTDEDFKRLMPLHQVADSRFDNDGFWVVSSGDDPNFELAIAPEYKGLDPLSLGVRMVAIFITVFCVTFFSMALIQGLRFVPLLLFGVWLLIIVMAGTSKRNAHPDEYVHLDATAYYEKEWLPPILEDPEIRHTYSAYGVSRLNNGEVYYLIAGKLKALVHSFNMPDRMSSRLFNVILFGIIVLTTINSRFARMAAIPYLVSPQVWYVFSYCSSDAFALFMAFVAACQLIDPESLLHRYLKGDGWWAKLSGILVLGLLLGTLFLLKKNYYPFIAFFYFCVLVKLFMTAQFYWERKEAVMRLVLISVVGLAIMGVRVGADHMVNGTDRQERLAVLQEELAHPWYKPSAVLVDKHIALHMKDRGVPLTELITKDFWFEKTFRSSFGMYGYFTICSPKVYYDLVRWSGLALLVFVVGSIVIRGGLVGNTLLAAVLGLSAALIGVSLYHSWTMDFQAQGRYLFPIIPLLGILYGLNHRAVHSSFLSLGVVLMYSLAVYNFIFEALLRIPKAVI